MSFEFMSLVFAFLYGCCIGSFLNVVVYRMPRDKSLVSPPSACPACGKHIRWFDNIPLLSWLMLGAKCRNCKAPISARYFIVELVTGLLFAGVFAMYFVCDVRRFGIDGAFGLEAFIRGGWLLYLVHIVMLSAFLAASAIDLQLWVIPLSICWLVTAVGVAASALSGFVIDPATIWSYNLFPSASATTGALSAGAVVGLAIGLLGLVTGVIKRSYESECEKTGQPGEGDSENQSGGGESGNQPETGGEKRDDLPQSAEFDDEDFNDRAEMLRETLFLSPIIVCSVVALAVVRNWAPVGDWWSDFSQTPVVTGLLGSLWGYFVGCGTVWAVRILGTLAFGKEAMGLGDVHLMGAAGAVIGPAFVVIAFFIAPFFGLGWAFCQMFFKKTRQIPYGPFLSMGILAVMILHDWFRDYLESLRILY